MAAARPEPPALQLARAHASDPAFESPYVIEAKKQGYDLPWWEKVKGVKIKDGKLALGELQVRRAAPPPPPARRRRAGQLHVLRTGGCALQGGPQDDIGRLTPLPGPPPCHCSAGRQAGRHHRAVRHGDRAGGGGFRQLPGSCRGRGRAGSAGGRSSRPGLAGARCVRGGGAAAAAPRRLGTLGHSSLR